MSAWSDIGNGILDELKKIKDDIVNLVTEEPYQSPLEATGIAMRNAMKPVMYYGKKYPYATPVPVDFIRTNSAYVAASGWRPSTYGLNLDIHDEEWSKICGNFEEQTGGGVTSQYRVTNTANTTSDASVIESYGFANNYNANTRDRVSVTKIGNQED